MSAAVTFEVLTGQYSNVTAQLKVPDNHIEAIVNNISKNDDNDEIKKKECMLGFMSTTTM